MYPGTRKLRFGQRGGGVIACGVPAESASWHEERAAFLSARFALWPDARIFNDCAVAIAEYVAGTTENFAALMNDKAEEIGCNDTYFITPNGLDATNQEGFHHTTAEDLAKIMRYCIRISDKAEEFLEITGTAQYSLTILRERAATAVIIIMYFYR